MDSGNRYPPQDENAPHNAETEFFRPPQPPQQRQFPARQYQQLLTPQPQPPTQGQYLPHNGYGQPSPIQQGPFQPQYGNGQQQPFQPGQFQSAYGPPQQPPFQPMQPQKRSLGRWFASKKRTTKIGLGCGGIFILLMLCTISLAAYGNSLPKQTSMPTPTQSIKNAAGGIVQTNPTAVPTTPPTMVPTQIPTPVPTQKPTPTPQPTQQPTATTASNGLAATHGIPQVGGPMSDFVGKYGQPISQGDANSQNFYTDNTQTIIVNVRPSGQNQQVTYLSVLGPDSWSDDQTKTSCMQYLPSDAVEYNAVDSLTDYHSSVGMIVLNNAGGGTCTLYMAQS